MKGGWCRQRCALGNAAVLPISWMYIRMMGAEGLKAATETAILCANYISARLRIYPTLYASEGKMEKPGHVAHECILDCASSRTPAASWPKTWPSA